MPAPWSLAEKGYAPRGAGPKGGLGAVMIVDHRDSDAGPYSEFLFMPGKLELNGGRWHRITKIYVSTYDSVLNGRKNWAIPMEKADYTFDAHGREERVSVSRGGVSFFAARLKPWGIPFPVSTIFLPFSLLQEDGDGYLQTSFSGRGIGRLASVKEMGSLQDYFPDLSGLKPVLAVRVEPFKIVFPVAARVEKAEARTKKAGLRSNSYNLMPENREPRLALAASQSHQSLLAVASEGLVYRYSERR